MQHATTIQFGGLHQRHVTISRLGGTCSVCRTPNYPYTPPSRLGHDVAHPTRTDLANRATFARKQTEEAKRMVSEEIRIGAFPPPSFLFGFVGFVRFLLVIACQVVWPFSVRFPLSLKYFFFFFFFLFPLVFSYGFSFVSRYTGISVLRLIAHYGSKLCLSSDRAPLKGNLDVVSFKGNSDL